MYIKQKYVFVEQSPMHVRVIPYLVQYMRYNFKNILIYIYINRFISVRLSAELMYSVIYIYICGS